MKDSTISGWWRDGKVRIMGIVNVTPDSFSDGGDFAAAADAVAHGLRLVAAGADILDIGGESTRPGAAAIDPATEWARIGPVIEGLQDCGVPLSVDTRHALTMRRALAAGAGMINDVTALRGDADSLTTVAQGDYPVCLMHMKGEPRTMQDNPHYNDVIAEIRDFFAERIETCERAGLDRNRIVIDPGIGFGKNLVHNLTLLRELGSLLCGDVPVLVGVSRKRFINELCTVPDPAARGPGTIAASLRAVDNGATIIRVHDVAAMKQALTVYQATG